MVTWCWVGRRRQPYFCIKAIFLKNVTLSFCLKTFYANALFEQIMRVRMRFCHVILFCISVMAFAGCSHLEKEPVALIESLSAKEIYGLGEISLNDEQHEKAAEYFGEIERLFPYSEWAKRGLIMQAFSFHRGLDYPNSRSTAQRYIDFYPASTDAAYAQYILALSYYDQIADVGRDQGLTLKALQELRLLI